jgi:LCP family protein required for cell wall assembly
LAAPADVRTQIGARAFMQRLRNALIAAVLCTVLAIGGAYWVAAQKVAQVPKVKIDTSVLEPGGNYLLVGSDSRSFVDSAQDAQRFGSAQTQSGQRSDTIMVAHVDGEKGTGFLLSFPRDLWVDIPGIGRAKINAAFNAGPQRLIETIEQDFDVPISHYLQADFAGFRKIVDAIGTIPISFPFPAQDAFSGLRVNQAGCRRLSGQDALAYVRSRYYESFQNGRWRPDPTSDLGRIKRQQYFLRTLAHEALHTSQRAPWRGLSILDATLASLQRDPEFGFSSFRALAYAFHGDNASIETFTLPTRAQTIDGQAALVLDEKKAKPLLDRLRGIENKRAPAPPAGVSPDSVRVTVENGSGRQGVGSTTLEALHRLGFAVLGQAANADRNDYAVSEVRYSPGAQDKARLVLAYLGGAGKLAPLQGTAADGDADVVLVIGRDFSGVSAPAARAPSSGAPATRSTSSATAPSTAPADALPPVGC